MRPRRNHEHRRRMLTVLAEMQWVLRNAQQYAADDLADDIVDWWLDLSGHLRPLR